MEKVQDVVRGWIRVSLSKPDGKIFENILNLLETEISKAVGSVLEFKKRSTKAKGDYFEALCLLYLRGVKGWVAYPLRDIPPKEAERLSIPKNDVGIDLIAFADGQAVAVQCKYRKPTPEGRRRKGIPWKELSTFYALCARTGPWYRRLVMTNAPFVSRKGMRDESDRTTAGKTFSSLTRLQWSSMLPPEIAEGHILAGKRGEKEKVVGEERKPVEKEEKVLEGSAKSFVRLRVVEEPPTKEEVRDLRAKLFAKLSGAKTS